MTKSALLLRPPLHRVTRRHRIVAFALAALTLGAGCDAFGGSTTSADTICEQYAAQAKARMEFEAAQVPEIVGRPVDPDALFYSPKNIERVVREIKPRCLALTDEERACPEAATPVFAAFLQKQDACADEACRVAAAEAAFAKLGDTCMQTLEGLHCERTKDCKP